MSQKSELHIFCQNIRDLRQRHNLTQTQMARIMGVGLHSVRCLERNIVPPRLSCEVIYTLSNHFHLHSACLFIPLYGEPKGRPSDLTKRPVWI